MCLKVINYGGSQGDFVYDLTLLCDLSCEWCLYSSKPADVAELQYLPEEVFNRSVLIG